MQQPPASTIKALSVLHFSLLVGQIVFATIAYYLHYSKSMHVIDMGENASLFIQAVGVTVLLLVFLSFYLYKKKVAAIRANAQAVKEKLIAYRAASLVRWAMLEAPVLLVIIGFMLTAHYSLLALAGAILVIFISVRPTVSRAAAELDIPGDEVSGDSKE